MKVTHENIKDIKYLQGTNDIDLKSDLNLLDAILIDIEELNQLLEDNGEGYRKVFIDYCDTHTEYSSEWTDPCPDYYGMFTLRFEKDPYETIGLEMTIDELDSAACLLVNFVEFKLS